MSVEEEYLDYSCPPAGAGGLQADSSGGGVVKEVKVKSGAFVTRGSVVWVYTTQQDVLAKFKSSKSGRIHQVLVNPGDPIKKGTHILRISGGCLHPTVMKDMCAECGADLKDDNKPDTNSASVSMVHSIPELKVSTSEATNLGKEDQVRLLKDRKLVLLVDLDQTLIHTTNDNIPPNIRDVYHFQLYGSKSPWYHTRIRPRTMELLKNLHSLYELHICTFGARMYAHKIAAFLDPEGKYFSHRILSRDECFDNRSKELIM
jgi:RNA polymerase II subunit A-like phosphatase